MGNYLSYYLKNQNFAKPVDLVCYECRYLYTVEKSHTPLCPWCSNKMAYLSTCNRCEKSFWSRYSIKNKCTICEKYRKCINCEKETFNDVKCENCKLIVLNCNNCGDEITDFSSKLFNKNYHRSCYDKIIKISDEMYDDKEITITYNSILTDHDGYCSDPFDENEIITKIKEKFPLSKSFTENDYDITNGKVNINNPKLSIYLKESEVCKLGSGYCGLGTIYNIKSAKIQNLNVN